MDPISINNLGKTYRGKRGKHVEALKQVSLSVTHGEVFGFVGPNGAGKSTTIKILVGLLQASCGEVFLCGQPVHDFSARKDVGYLPENPALYDFLTAEECLRFVGRTFGMDEAQLKQRSSEVLDLVNLSGAARRQVRSYSKGMVQRLAFAQTLIHDPQIYILDEPMSGLDPIGRALVKQIILDLKRRGKTIFFSTHITADVEAICDRVGVLIDGRLELVDVVDNLLSRSVNGYVVRVSGGLPIEDMEQVSMLNAASGTCEYFVAQNIFNDFVERIQKSGGALGAIEVKRKGIEDIFLEMVE